MQALANYRPPNVHDLEVRGLVRLQKIMRRGESDFAVQAGVGEAGECGGVTGRQEGVENRCAARPGTAQRMCMEARRGRTRGVQLCAGQRIKCLGP